MKIPCAKQVPFVAAGLSFLQPALTNIQFHNLILIASALVLGSRFCRILFKFRGRQYLIKPIKKSRKFALRG